MKKAVATIMVLVMMLALGASAFAEGWGLTLDQAKQAALDYAGVKAADATFVKAHQDWDDGRQVYDIKFYANGMEYDMDVDVNTGRITGFDMEYSVGYGQPPVNTQPSFNTQPAPNMQPTPNTQPGNYGYNDWDDWDDRYDPYDDWDDRYDYDRDWDDMYDRYDDWYDWDD